MTSEIKKEGNCTLIYNDFYKQYILLVKKPGGNNYVPHRYDTQKEAEEAMEKQISTKQKYWWED